MQTELQITIRDMAVSAALDSVIRAKIEKLEIRHPGLTRCHVVISEPHHHKQHPREFTVRINIAFPGGEAVVTRDDNEDVYVLVRDAFEAAGRELEKSSPHRAQRAAPHHNLASQPLDTAEDSNLE